MKLDLNKPAPDISALIERECDSAAADVLHFFHTANGVVASVVSRNDAQTLWERLATAWHVFMGRELEFMIHEPIVARIAARYNVLKAQVVDEIAKETFAMTGTEDVFASGTAAVPATPIGEVGAQMPLLASTSATP